MPADVLEQGRERRSGRPRSRPLLLVAVALAVLGAGALQGRGGQDTDRPPAGAVLERAAVLSVRETVAGALHVRIGVEGAPRAGLLSVSVDLPGNDFALLPSPDRLTDDGTGQIVVDLLPRCPGALIGLRHGSVTAAVRRSGDAPARQVRVRLDTDGELAQAVRARCGTVVGVPGLRPSLVELDGPAGEPLRTRVEVVATGERPVTVVAVQAGAGLTSDVRTPLPVVVRPGAPPEVLQVDLRLEGCGGAPETPPYLLVLSTGEAVAPGVARDVLGPLGALRPYQCAG